MSIESILQNRPEPFSIDGKEYSCNRFRVSEYAELRDILETVAQIFENAPTRELQISILLCEALKEVCVLIACGTSMTPEEIVSMDPQQFVFVLARVIEANADFFVLAAAESKSQRAAAK